MCDLDNWRRLDGILADVVEQALTKAIGAGSRSSHDGASTPGPRSTRGVALRSEWKVPGDKLPASCGAACAGEEVPLKATRRFETEAGQDAHLDRMHPSRRGYRVFRQMAGSAGPTAYPQHTSMDRRRVHTRPQEAAHASALRRSMRV
jgi:hypothetical protein